jgi:hypothetical protein
MEIMSHTRIVSALIIASAVGLAAPAPRAQTPATPPASTRPSLTGAWTFNKDLSDKPPSGGEGREGREGQHRGGGSGGGGHRGGFGGGGFGGGGGGAGRATDGRNPEDVQRQRNALRDELQPPEHLTITETGATVIMTAGDGRTTRLSVDGKKIKVESTNVERRTKRDGGKLVSEITGLGNGKITETYSVDDEHGQLHVALEIEGSKGKATTNRVYDADPR